MQVRHPGSLDSALELVTTKVVVPANVVVPGMELNVVNVSGGCGTLCVPINRAILKADAKEGPAVAEAFI